MSSSIYSDSKRLRYTDDSTIIFSHKNPDVIFSKLGKELESCSEWLVGNQLSLHLGKTKCILFGHFKYLKIKLCDLLIIKVQDLLLANQS